MLTWLLGSTTAPSPSPLGYRCPTTTELYDKVGLSTEHRRRVDLLTPDMQERLIESYEREIQAEAQDEATTALAGFNVHFKLGEPRTFAQFNGQLPVVEILKDAIGALDSTERSIRPQLFAGWAGNGKTLLAKIVANELNARNMLQGFAPAPFFEYMPVALEDVTALDELMRKVQQNPGCVVFLDEVHAVAGKGHFLKFYQVLEENRYHFEGEAHPVVLPPATYLAATTDYGILAEAFKRRWMVHFFQPATKAQLASYVRNRPFPIESAALESIVDRMWYSGAPWESLQIYDLAVNSAKAEGRDEVQLSDVLRVYGLHGVDALGLRAVDRQVLSGVFQLKKTKTDGETHYCGSEDNVVSMGRVDRSEFKATVRPKLMSRGLLEIRPYWGHTLTNKAVELYGHLRVTA